MHTGVWLESLKRRDNFEYEGIDGRIILKQILGKQGLRVWIEFLWFRIRTVASSCEHGSEPWDSIKSRELLD
jgi:hypothetical protein